MRPWIKEDTRKFSLDDIFLQLNQEVLVRGKRKSRQNSIYIGVKWDMHCEPKS